MKGPKELFCERHVCRHTKITTARGEAFHVLHFHLRQLGELVFVFWDQCSQGHVVVVGLLLPFNHDRIDAAVGVLVGLGREIRQLLCRCIPLVKDGDLGADGSRHKSFRNVQRG